LDIVDENIELVAMKDDDNDSNDSSQLPWDSPTDSRTPSSSRSWGHRSHLQGVGLIISGIILLVAISGYTGDKYGILSFGALIFIFVVVFAISFPYQIFSPVDELDE
jgi:predicted membrane channel-forming protein YqfA (hemolysin III family)